MIKLMLCCAFCFINTAAFAQKTTKTWVVNNPPYKGREKADIVVDRVELTPAYTIIGFVFDNSKGEDERFTICNTFKIEADNKRIATIVKAEGVPMMDAMQGFRCADETCMLIRAGQTIKFDLYFTAIPKNLDFIDLIEYNKAQDCEFDVYSVDIRQKKKTNPNKVQEIPVNLLTNERTTPHQESSKASVHKTAPIIDEPPAPPALDSTVSVKKDELALKMRIVDIEVWDNDKEDGDIISLKLNGNLILEHLELKKQPYKITVMLAKGENTLVMKAENLGTRGNNTAAIKINDSVLPPKTVILNSDMGHSEALRIVVK